MTLESPTLAIGRRGSAGLGGSGALCWGWLGRDRRFRGVELERKASPGSAPSDQIVRQVLSDREVRGFCECENRQLARLGHLPT